MALHKQKQNFLRGLAGASLVALFLVITIHPIIFAQQAITPGGAPDGTALQEQENIVCQDEMKPFLDTEFGNYVSFIETTVQSKSGTLSLLDTLIGRYREFRHTATAKYLTYFPQQGASQLTEGIEPEACSRMVREKLEEAKMILEIRVRSSSAVKKSTALLEKYQQINARLRTLHQSFVSLKAFLDTFSQKLPCYVKKSCNKG